MQLTLEVQSQQELQLILQYLRLLPSVRVLAEPKIKSGSAHDVIPEQKPKKDFSKYWGIIQTGLSTDEIDHRIQQMRSEWERDFS